MMNHHIKSKLVTAQAAMYNLPVAKVAAGQPTFPKHLQVQNDKLEMIDNVQFQVEYKLNNSMTTILDFKGQTALIVNFT